MVRVLTNGDLCCEINLSTTSYNSINLSCKNINNVLSPSLVSVDLLTHIKNGDLLLGVIGSHNNNEKAHKSLFDKKANLLDLSTVAQTGDYGDLTNKPTIPSVNNATITITQGGTTKGTFTLNQSTDKTIDIEEVDIDEIETDLNGKADVDLSNVNNTGTSSGASWAMPSNTYEDLTLGASGTDYTAPANGWISFVKQATGNQFIQFNNVTAGWFSNVNSASNGQYISIICPVKKGDIFQISYNTGGGTAQFIFIYAQGSESEAS